MTQFADLSPYTYIRVSSTEKNVGWLGESSMFDTMERDELLLEMLWRHCKISVAQTRGIHECELCRLSRSYIAERNGERLLLGSAEIRVISLAGSVYAAPNLIYHYVQAHQYRPPMEFIDAVLKGLTPGSKGYFDRLSEFGWSWTPTEVPNDLAGRRARSVATANGIKIVKE
jgi:hypothetical protein